MNDIELMRRAIDLAKKSVANGGGPFGAVIAKDGEIIAEAANSVTADCDPTAHAEVKAIRLAASRLGTFKLSRCSIYASCEPCPMCLGAIYWAHIDKLFYASNRKDAAAAGFDDDFIYRELSLPPSERRHPATVMLSDEAAEALRLWIDKADKTLY